MVITVYGVGAKNVMRIDAAGKKQYNRQEKGAWRRMEGFHPMQEKLDIKILILFILDRLPDTVDGETLANLALADGAVGYFEYAECLAELEDSGHVERSGYSYRITEKGSRNCRIVETSLPYTLRSRLAKQLAPVAEGMRRRAMITAEHEDTPQGCRVHLALSDGAGEIMDACFLCGGESRAEKIEENFRQDAEKLYNQIMEILLT